MGQYSIRLSQEQRQTLEKFVTAGTAAARAIMHAQVMLKADTSSSGPNWSDRQIEQAFGVSYRTILRIRQRFVEQGMQAAWVRAVDLALAGKPSGGIGDRGEHQP